jgi:hypothetical protein
LKPRVGVVNPLTKETYVSNDLLPALLSVISWDNGNGTVNASLYLDSTFSKITSIAIDQVYVASIILMYCSVSK